MLGTPKGLNTLMVTILSILQWTISRKPNYKLNFFRGRSSETTRFTPYLNQVMI